jgi:hypothetical protein
MITLSPTKITTAQQLLANYAPAQETLPILAANTGDFADCFDRRRRKRSYRLSKFPTFNDPTTKKSLWRSPSTSSAKNFVVMRAGAVKSKNIATIPQVPLH